MLKKAMIIEKVKNSLVFGLIGMDARIQFYSRFSDNSWDSTIDL